MIASLLVALGLRSPPWRHRQQRTPIRWLPGERPVGGRRAWRPDLLVLEGP